LACAAAIVNLDLFETENTLNGLQEKIKFLTKNLKKFETLKHVKVVRQKGFMVGIELVKNKKTNTPYSLKDKIGIRVCQHIRTKGVILRPLGPVIVLMPPLSIDLETLEELVSKTFDAIKEITEN
jgi:adenosylmethionine-8-amino-7-oxononanoate aminotransferase